MVPVNEDKSIAQTRTQHSPRLAAGDHDHRPHRTEPRRKSDVQRRGLLSSQALYLVIKIFLGASSGDHSLNEVFRKNSEPVLDPIVSLE